jgi:tetratricopeptide (TPR) repeat protein
LIANSRIDVGPVIATLSVQRRFIDEALQLARNLGDERQRCFTLQSMGRVLQLEERSDEAHRVFVEAVDVARSLGDDDTLGYALTMKWRYREDAEEVDELLVEAVDCFRRAQDLIGLSRALHLYATTVWNHALLGDERIPASVVIEEEVLEIARTIGDDYSAAQAIGNMGIVAFAMGDVDLGEEYSRQCLQTHRRMGEPNWQASCVYFIFSYIAIARDDFTRAAQLYGAAQLLRDQFPPFGGFDWADVELQMIEENGQRLRDVLGEDSYVRETSLGRTLSYDDVYRLALTRIR